MKDINSKKEVLDNQIDDEIKKATNKSYVTLRLEGGAESPIKVKLGKGKEWRKKMREERKKAREEEKSGR